MPEAVELIPVEVVYALPEKQHLIRLELPRGTTALQAVALSGLLELYPALHLHELGLGIFSKPLDGRHLPLPDVYELHAQDRVEIYRPLLVDPKQARLQRAVKAKKSMKKTS